MTNLIKKYGEFIFEADSVSTQISNTKLEISKLKDGLRDAKKVLADAKKSATDESAQMKADSNYAAKQVEIYGKMVPLLNTLKSQIDKRITELKA